MKKTRLLFAGFMLLAGSFSLTAQQKAAPGGGGTPVDGCDASCLTGSLNISTGFVQSSGTYNTAPATESNWTLVAVPPSVASFFPSLPMAPYDINPHPAWSSFPGGPTWVSAFQFANYTPNNCPPADPFVFEKCFCMCRDADITIDFQLLVDDGAEILLDGTPIASAMAGWQFQWNNRLIYNNTFHLAAGRHCIDIKLYNCGGVAMGFSLSGTVSGFNLLKPSCCSNTGSICVTKVLDSNCDGVVDPTIDPGLAGWTIELHNSGGTLIASGVTGDAGTICFDDLAPGTYTVNEVNQPGWTQTYPASGGYTITINAGDVGSAVFGNCQNSDPPCNVFADYNISVHDCQVSLTALYPTLPPGFHLVSTFWTFGDGQSSNQANPVHYYANPGVYTICLTVTIFNGKECCSKQFCQEVRIDKGCGQGCNFNATIDQLFDGSNCMFGFSANVAFAGLPVTDIFWDFGDGNYGSGPIVFHQFPTSGNYTVCMYLFANDPATGGCCFQKFCLDVVVNCEPCGGDGTGSDGTGGIDKNMATNIQLSDKNVVVLKQNVPNPFAESTTIFYSIPTNCNKAQIIFTNTEGKIIKTVDLSHKGDGQLNVFSDDLSSGTYTYTLIVDGKTMDTKRMVKN